MNIEIKPGFEYVNISDDRIYMIVRLDNAQKNIIWKCIDCISKREFPMKSETFIDAFERGLWKKKS